jgi:hypothetical protein
MLTNFMMTLDLSNLNYYSALFHHVESNINTLMHSLYLFQPYAIAWLEFHSQLLTMKSHNIMV